MKNKITNTKMNLRVILIAICLFISGNLFSQSQGVNSPGYVTEQFNGCLGCPGAEWSGTTNAEVSDNSFAVTQMMYYDHCFQTACYYTRALMPSKYNFNIPGNAIIRGIQVEIQKKGSNPNTVIDTVVELMKGGIQQTAYNASLPGYWTLADSMYQYGDSSNLWGTTWLPSDINDSAFGVFFIPENKNPNNVAAFVDFIGITVYYTIVSGEIMMSSSNNSMNIVTEGNQALTITTNLNEPAANSKLQLFNLLGQNMFSKDLNNIPKGYSKQGFNIGSLPEGVYFAELIAGENKFLKKIIISK